MYYYNITSQAILMSVYTQNYYITLDEKQWLGKVALSQMRTQNYLVGEAVPEAIYNLCLILKVTLWK